MASYFWSAALVFTLAGSVSAQKPGGIGADHGAGKPTQSAGKTRQVDASTPEEKAFNAACAIKTSCVVCHNGVRVSPSFKTEADVLDYVEKGDPAASGLVQRMLSADPGLMMPPPRSKENVYAGNERLRTEHIAALREWISAGAPAFPAGYPDTLDCDAAPPRPNQEAQTQPERPPVYGPQPPPPAGVFTPENAIVAVAKDLEKLEREQGLDINNSPYVYFYASHLSPTMVTDANKGIYDPEMIRDALKWSVNLTSRGKKIVLPVDVSGGKGLVFRVDRRDYLWPTDAIAAIKAGDPITRLDVMRGRGHLKKDPLIDAALQASMPADYFVRASVNWDGYQKLLAIPDDQVAALNGHAWQNRVTAQYRGRGRYETSKFFMPESQADAAKFNREVVYMETPPVNQVPGRTPTGPFVRVLMSMNYEKADAQKQADNQLANICPLAGVQGAQPDLIGDPASFDVVGQLPNGLVGFARFGKDGKTDAEIVEKGPKFCLSCHLNRNGVFPFTDTSEKEITGVLDARRLDANTKVGIRNLYPGEEEKVRTLALFTDAFVQSQKELRLELDGGNKKDSRFAGAKFTPGNTAGYAGANYSNDGKQPVILIDRVSQEYDISKMAGMAGTTDGVIREAIRRDPELRKVFGFVPPDQLTTVSPDKFLTAFPKIMRAVPQLDKEMRGADSPYYKSLGGRAR